MRRTRQYLKLGLCLLAFFLFINHSNADNEIRDFFDSKSKQIITEGILNQQIRIVPQLNKLNFGLGRYDGINFYYKKKR